MAVGAGRKLHQGGDPAIFALQGGRRERGSRNRSDATLGKGKPLSLWKGKLGCGRSQGAIRWRLREKKTYRSRLILVAGAGTGRGTEAPLSEGGGEAGGSGSRVPFCARLCARPLARLGLLAGRLQESPFIEEGGRGVGQVQYFFIYTCIRSIDFHRR